MAILLKAFQALHGDCLLLSYKGDNAAPSHNILIDAGFASTFHRTLKSALVQIREVGENIDLLIVTHVDNDHITGFIPMFLEFGVNDIKSVWFNASPERFEFPSPEGQIGVAEGVQVRDYLLKMDKISFDRIHTPQVHNIHGAQIRILSPLMTDLDKFRLKWKVFEDKVAQKANQIAPRLSDKKVSIQELLERKSTLDNSLSNRTSISFLFAFNGKTLLLSSDAHPDVIESSLTTLGYSTGAPVNLALMQVAHHGSRFNITSSLLGLIRCNHYLISTNGGNPYLFPHKETLARIVVSAYHRLPGEPIYFYFTYDDPILRDIFTLEEVTKYNIISVYPKTGEYGTLIKFE